MLTQPDPPRDSLPPTHSPAQLVLLACLQHLPEFAPQPQKGYPYSRSWQLLGAGVGAGLGGGDTLLSCGGGCSCRGEGEGEGEG